MSTNRNWTHAELVERAGRWLSNSARTGEPDPLGFLNLNRCEVVLLEPHAGRENPDAIGWFSCGHRSILIECKASRIDFLADKKKYHRHFEKNGLGRYRFYMSPPGIITTEDLQDSGWGLLEVHGRTVKIVTLSREFEYFASREHELIWSACRLYQIAERERNDNVAMATETGGKDMSNKLTTAELPDIGKRIRDLHLYAWADYDRALERARDAGLLLIEAKPLVGHGKWESWVSTNCRFESPQATKYMRIADQWDEIQQKRTSGSPLTINEAVRLIAKPKPEPTGPPEEDVPRICPECGGGDFFDDGTCRACIQEETPGIIDTPLEAVCEAPGEEVDDEPEEEPEEPESDGTDLRSALMLTIQHWLDERPDAPECLVLSILESLAAEWK